MLMDILFIGFFALICILLVVSLGRELDEKKKSKSEVTDKNNNTNNNTDGNEENKTTSETK